MMKKSVVWIGIIIVVVCTILEGCVQSSFMAYFGIAVGVVISVYGAFLRSDSSAAKFGRYAICVLCALGFMSFVAVECVIQTAVTTDSDYTEDCLIVLGGGLIDDVPTDAMRSRLDGALEYIEKNPEVTVIACGGIGQGETISEASVIRDYLIKAGVASYKILTDEKSYNTNENMKNASGLIGSDSVRVAILTSEFHMWRAKYLARRYGISASGVCVKTPRLLSRLQYYLKEYFSIIKALTVN